MKLLFVHQNFPAQFMHLVTYLVQHGHEVVALGVEGRSLPGIKFFRYKPQLGALRSAPSLVQEIATKTARGLGVVAAIKQIKLSGFTPDIVVAHSGWGESLFIKDVLPDVPLLCFLEFFYSSDGEDYGFDSEFSVISDESRYRLRLRNSPHLMAMHAMDWGMTPTQWQHGTLPVEYRRRTSVIFDGIDTTFATPNLDAVFKVPDSDLQLRRADKVVTFVNRNIEPYRGCHTFFRALPKILKDCPTSKIIIVGDTGVSYGAAPPKGSTWKDIFLNEISQKLPSNWQERVLFVGRLPHPDLIKLFQVSCCHVYLTYPFVLSWSCLEAMSVGCAIVASDTPPVKEVITDGVHGVLTNFFDAQQLADKVAHVVNQPMIYDALGHAARLRVVQRYDLKSKSLPKQVSLLNALCSGIMPA